MFISFSNPSTFSLSHIHTHTQTQCHPTTHTCTQKVTDPSCAAFSQGARWVGELVKVSVEDADLGQSLHGQLLNLL